MSRLPNPLVNGTYSLKDFRKKGSGGGVLIIGLSGGGTGTFLLKYRASDGALVDIGGGVLSVGEQYVVEVGDLDVFLDASGVSGAVVATIGSKG